MKLLGMMFVVFVATTGLARAQEQSEEPKDVVVLAKNWRRIRMPGPLDDNPFAANDQARDSMRIQTQASAVNSTRTRTGDVAVPPWKTANAKRTTTTPSSDNPNEAYVYSTKLKNLSRKTITLVVWDYIFTHPETQQELGRHRSRTVAKIHHGKSTELMGFSTSPPTRILIATSPHHASAKLNERIEIHRVEYENGSSWQKPTP